MLSFLLLPSKNGCAFDADCGFLPLAVLTWDRLTRPIQKSDPFYPRLKGLDCCLSLPIPSVPMFPGPPTSFPCDFPPLRLAENHF